MNQRLPLWALRTLFLLTIAPAAALAGAIVPGLNDGDATEFTAPDQEATITDPGSALANGLTLAVRTTMDSTDIANSATGAINLLEIGGTTSGTSLLVVNGSYWVSGSAGNAQAQPISGLDLDGSDGVIGVEIGAVLQDVEQEVFFSLDNANSRLVVGLDGVISEYALTGVGAGWNWRGNRTMTFAGNNDTLTGNPNPIFYGWRGGLSDDNTDGVFFTNNAFDPSGTVSLGQYFNTVTSVPEPSALLLLSLGVLGVLRRR